jgi:hypothetical protein
MADYQAFNYGTPQELAERAAAWNGYNGWDNGGTIPQSLRDFMSKVYNTTSGPAIPSYLSGDDLVDWGRSAGYNLDQSDQPWNPATWTYSNPSGASQYQLQMGQGAFTSPDGRYHISGGDNGWMIDDLSRGAGEKTNAWYNQDGTFNHDNTGAKNMTNWQGVLAVVGAALGFGALGAATAGGAAAGTAAGGAEAGAAGAAGSGAAAGAAEAGAAGAGVTGFGDAGLMYGGADAAAAGSLGGGASVAGGSALGAGAAGAGLALCWCAGREAGVTGFGDAGTMYGGADAASASLLAGAHRSTVVLRSGSGTSVPPAGGWVWWFWFRDQHHRHASSGQSICHWSRRAPGARRPREHPERQR